MFRTFGGLLLLGTALLPMAGAQAQDVETWHGRADGGSEGEARAKAKIAAFDQISAFGPLEIVAQREGKCDSYGGTSWTCEYDVSYTRTPNGSLRVPN